MMDDDIWGPWKIHDGKGCPCVGMWVQVEDKRGAVEECRATGIYNEYGSAWDWASIDAEWQFRAIIRYRIRKPRGLTILEELIADLPAPVGPKIDA